jgi:radical SAM superfamily enzyme YgiQ (UPF0313 family)
MPAIDIIVRKEGEQTFTELLQRVEAKQGFGDVLGITFRGPAEKLSET